MRHSKRYEDKLKKKLLTSMLSIAIVTALIVGSTLVGFSAPANRLAGVSDFASIATGDNNTTIGTPTTPVVRTPNKLQNTSTTTYIYTAQDLANFRDSVNAGNTYEGKIIYLMNDIDLSSVCSASIGSWEPIGTTETYFVGTFDGNYHKISNLYINSGSYAYTGLFRVNGISSIIKNTLLDNVYIYNSYSSSDAFRNCLGGIIGINNGIIKNCAVLSGSITGYKVIINSNINGAQVGGIAGNNGREIDGCFNRAKISSIGSTSSSSSVEIRVGGIAAPQDANISGKNAAIRNCYNAGIIEATGRQVEVGGILGVITQSSGGTSSISNCYNYGKVSALAGTTKYVGGVIGLNGLSSTYKPGTITNSYATTTSSTYSNYYFNGSKRATTNNWSRTPDTLKGYASTLGSAYMADTYGINDGYPILKWQAPSVSLDFRQEYIRIGDELHVTAVPSASLEEIYGRNLQNSDFTWSSSNTDVATVDSNGHIRGVGIGSATITAYNSRTGVKAKGIVNVYRNVNGAVAIPQVETADGYTVVLKEDGTVWCAGENINGNLGDGTEINRNIPVQVKTAQGRYLTNVIKISKSSALTADGEVYVWGDNSYGQLGQGDTQKRLYATKMRGVGGSGYLSDIIDIEYGLGTIYALSRSGIIYGAGYGYYYQLNDSTGNATLPIAVTGASDAIDITAGYYDLAYLTSKGEVYFRGNSEQGAAGTGTTSSGLTQTLSAEGVNEVELFGQSGVILKEDGTVYTTGINESGQLGLGDTTRRISWTQVKYEDGSALTTKAISAGLKNIEFMNYDGKIWVTGANGQGQLGLGNTTNVTYPTLMKNEDGTEITDCMLMGTSGRTINYSSNNNVAIIRNDGSIWITGPNDRGQYGNIKTDSDLYIEKYGPTYLNYLGNEIIIKENETYQIKDSDFIASNEFNIFVKYERLDTVGTLEYECLDDTKASVSSTGLVTGLKEGFTRVKVTDTTNNHTTYIIVKVINEKGEGLELGEKFSVGLTTSGEVWTWGSNFYGELGINSEEEYKDTPKHVEGISKVKDIGAGAYHAVALTRDGEIYTWGLNNYGQLGNGKNENSKIPVKVEGFEDIDVIKVDAYKYGTTALDREGNVYIWGDKFGNRPVRIVNLKALDISENVIINRERKIQRLDGYVYNYVNNVVKVSVNDEEILAILDNGDSVSINAQEAQTKTIGNAIDVKCGVGYGIILDDQRNVYTYGKNNTHQLGNGGNATVSTPTKITTENTEIIAGSEGGHTAVADKDGFIYTVGLNDKGQLGHGNQDTIPNLKLLLNIDIESNVDKIVKQVGESEVVELELAVTLNLKKELMEDTTTTISIVDDTIASVRENSDGRYTVTGRKMGRTFLNASVVGNIMGEMREFGANIEVRIVPEGGITVPGIVSGNEFTVALRANGDIATWGNNQYGQLGLGHTENKDEPQIIEKIEETIVEIAVGNNHVLALGESGKIYAWGLNDKGQIGNGTLATQVTQARVINIYGNELSKIIRVEAHGDNSFAINEEGKVYAWGKDYGTKATEQEQMENVIDVSTEYFVKAEGTVWTNEEIPEKLEIVGKVRQMDEGATHTVFLTTEGRAYGIGDNTFGQLGNGNNVPATSKVVAFRKDTVNLFENVVSVVAGDRYTVLLTNDGRVYMTGINENGMQGIDSAEITDISIPRVNDNISEVMLISAGKNHISVAKTNGEVYSWGAGSKGQLGNRERLASVKPEMTGGYIVRVDENHPVLGKTDTKEIKARVDYFNILKEDKIDINAVSKNTQVAVVSKGEDGKFTITGVNEGTASIVLTEGQTGSIGILDTEVLPVAGTEISPMVETKGSHTLTLKTNGEVWAYGQNNFGQLGNGTVVTEDEPRKVNFGVEGIKIKQIAVGENHSLALDSDGTVWAWGRNNYYQLGRRNLEYSLVPVRVEGLPKVKRIASGNNSVMVITEDGRIYAWGQNAYGELGTGEYTNKEMPREILGVHDVLDIQGGKSHYTILKTTGDVYTAGSNLYGQLGREIGEKTRESNFEKLEIDLKIGSISSSWTSNIGVTLEGKVYVWGQNIYGNLGTGSKTNVMKPTRISNVDQIVEAGVGKVHSILRNVNGYVYLAGTSAYGELGDGTTNNSYIFTRNNNIQDVLRVTAGNTYTVVMKKDGFVWGWGDYNHGNKSLKSSTRSKVPVQIGSDTSSLENVELIVKKSEVKSIKANSQFVFNLIYEELNENSNFRYESINEEIAEVNEYGEVLGVKTGSTWVKITDTNTGKVNIAIVRVIDNPEGYNTYTAPKIEAGETFTVALKENGNIDIWGYDVNGMVDLDVPNSMNVAESYIDVRTGKDFVLALRKDGTVWTAGDNSVGQLGTGSGRNENKLVQIQELSNIERIACGDRFGVAMDSFGITYVWGEGYGTKPVVLETNIRKATNLASGGRDQIVFVLPSGEVYGIGSILNNKKIPNLSNAIKVEVGENYILILTNDGKILKYQNGILGTVVSKNGIDISVKGNTNAYQDINGNVYTWGDNTYGQSGINGTSGNIGSPVVPVENGTNAFRVEAGYRNTYIIDNTGLVYGAGDNTYGQIGNGTKKEVSAVTYGKALTHTLIGDRNFTVEPETAIMEQNDIENIKIISKTYNVFREGRLKDVTEYNFASKDTAVVEVLEEIVEGDDGIKYKQIKAKEIGKTNIEVRDDVTGKKVEITRKVVPMDQNRIESIMVNGEEGKAGDSSDDTVYISGYTVEVPLDDDQTAGELVIKTKNETDEISIDGGNTYFASRSKQNIEIIGESLVIPVIVKATNGTEFKYEITVLRVSNNNGIEGITVNGYNAIKSETEEGVYEIIITDQGTNKIAVTPENANSKVEIRGIEGKEYDISLADGYVEVPIKVISESGIERNSRLKIYTEEERMKLEEIAVNGKYLTAEADGTYKAIIGDDVNRSELMAKAKYGDVTIGINGSDKEPQKITRNVMTINDVNGQSVELTAELIVDGVEKQVSKVYVVNIYKNRVFSKVQKVEVNGEVLEEENNTYTAYVLSNVEEANIKITAKETNFEIDLGGKIGRGVLETTESLGTDLNTYIFTVDGEEYILKIIRGETDTGIKKITVGKGGYVVEAVDTGETIGDSKVYEAKILDKYTNVDVTVQTVVVTSKISILGDPLVGRKAIKNMDLNDRIELVPITIKTEDEATEEEYILRIVRQEDNSKLEKVSVNERLGGADLEANYLGENRYEVYLQNAVQTIDITGITESAYATISINGEEEKIHTQTIELNLTQAETEIEIIVKSEAGTEERYYLTIYTISDEVGIETITVDGVEAVWNSTNSRYEIKVDRNKSSYVVQATARTDDSKISINGIEGIHTIQNLVANETETTIAKIKVTAENGITEKTNDLAIIEKSNNSKLGYIKVNGQGVAPQDDGTYKVEVVSTVKNVLIEIGAENANATIDLEGETQVGVWKNSKELASDDETYNVVITAEDGVTVSGTYVIHIIRKDGDTEIQSVSVNYTYNGTSYTKTPTLESNGTYYIKVPDISSINVNVIAKKATSKVNLLGTESLKQVAKDFTIVGETLRVPIIITAEDGTKLTTELVVELPSTDTELDLIEVKDTITKENIQLVSKGDNKYSITIDKDVNTVDLTAIPRNRAEKVKIVGDSSYVSTIQDRNVNILGKDKITIQTLAEIGNITKDFEIEIIRTFDPSIDNVTVNGDAVTLGGTINIVNGDAGIEIRAKKTDAEIYLLKDGVQVATGVGTLTVTESLTEGKTENYKIKIQGPGTYSTYYKEYTMALRRQDTNNDATIVLDDNITLTENSDTGKYEATVGGANHNIKVNASVNARVTIDGVSANSKNFTINGGEKKEFTIVVRSESGQEKTYIVEITRTIFDTSLDRVTVNGENVTLGGEENIVIGDATIEITSKRSDAEIYLIKDGIIVGAGTGTLNVTETLEEETASKYTIKIQGTGEYSSDYNEYILSLRNKSTNNNAIIKVNGVAISKDPDTGAYKATVNSVSNTLTVEPVSKYAGVTIDGVTAKEANVILNTGETKTINVIVTSESGEAKEYVVVLYKEPSKDVSIKSLESSGDVKKENENTYIIDVDSRLTGIEITAVLTDPNGTISVSGPGVTSANGTGKIIFTKTMTGGIEDITIEVTAEDGVTKGTYTVKFNKVFNTKVKYVKVDGENAEEDEKNKAYTALVENTENHSIEVKADNEDAIISIYDSDNNLIMTDTGTVTIARDSILGEKKEYKIVIEGPGDYSSYREEYKLEINKKSKDVTAKFYVNGTELVKDMDTGKYRIVTNIETNVFRVETTDKKAIINVDGGKPFEHQYIGNYTVKEGETKEIHVTITSQNGESEDYVIEIENTNSNTDITSITVNSKSAIKINNEIYRSEQTKDKTNAEVKISLSNSLGMIEAKVDGVTFTGKGTLTFNIPLSGSGTVKQMITVIAEDGTKRNVEISIVQNLDPDDPDNPTDPDDPDNPTDPDDPDNPTDPDDPNNPSNKSDVIVKVNGTEASKLSSSTYQIFIDAFAKDEVSIELAGANEKINIRYGGAEGQTISFTDSFSKTKEIIIIDFKSVAENGDIKDYTLYIMKESRDNSIKKLYVNGIEVQKGENGRYTAYVDNTTGNPKVKVETNNEYAYVRIATFEEEAKKTEKVIDIGENRTTVVPIKIRSQSGETNTEYLDIIATYVVGNIEEVIVDDIEITDYNKDTRTYTAIVDGNLAEHEITVVTDNNYVTLELGGDTGIGSVTTITRIENGDLVKELTLYITGETNLTETYKIKLVRKSNNTGIAEVKVNDVTLEMDPETLQYHKDIDKIADKAKIKVITEYPYAGIKIGDCEEEYGQSSEVWVNLKLDENEITIPVVITAVDGTTISTYNIILRRVSSKISGSITTDNIEGKHIAKVTLYDMRTNNIIQTVKSKEDGTYEVEAGKSGTYKLVIEKEGYLKYTVTDIEIGLGDVVTVEEHHIISGDVAPTGMIGLEDLVDINDNYGVIITDENKETKGIYDLNEDGIVDELDRDLLVEHLDLVDEIIQWVAPVQTFMMTSSMNIMSVEGEENEEFILPIASEYRISSDYGYRIHPTTKEYKLHAGIDLVGKWHTEILSVADGIVTYAGEQKGYGNCVEIKHIVNGETIYSFYAHLSEIEVEVGDTVSQGEEIGLEGGAESDEGHGTSTGHHLHFELRTETGSGHSIDPKTYIIF